MRLVFPRNVLKDDSVTLRRVAPTHANALFLLTDTNRDYLRQWLPWLDFTTEEKHTLSFIRSSMKDFLQRKAVQYSLWHRGNLIGMVGTHQIDWANRSASLGYWIGRKYGGQGLLTKACHVLIDELTNRLHLHRIVIRCATGNARSRAVAERLGLTQESVMKDAEWLYDHYVDHAAYVLLTQKTE